MVRSKMSHACLEAGLEGFCIFLEYPTSRSDGKAAMAPTTNIRILLGCGIIGQGVEESRTKDDNGKIYTEIQI